MYKNCEIILLCINSKWFITILNNNPCRKRIVYFYSTVLKTCLIEREWFLIKTVFHYTIPFRFDSRHYWIFRNIHSNLYFDVFWVFDVFSRNMSTFEMCLLDINNQETEMNMFFTYVNKKVQLLISMELQI